MHLSEADIASVLDHRSVVETLGRAFTDLGHGRAKMHARQRTECLDVKLSSMGAIWHSQGVAATKVYTTKAGNFCFAILLFDTRSNRLLAVLEGQELTRHRTAAITSLVALRLLPRKPLRLTLIGAGVQGRAQVECLCEFFRFDEICVVDPVVDRRWISELGGRWKTAVRIEDAEPAVRHADVVVTATRSTAPVLDGSWIKPGALVAAVGTSSPGSRELDQLTMQRADRVYVDWLPQGVTEAGEIAMWTDGREWNKVFDVPQLLTQPLPERDDSAITVFKSVGTGLADLAAAWLAYERTTSRCSFEDAADSRSTLP